MSDLFSLSAPLMIKSPHGGKKVIAEIYPHPSGIVFFEIFWDQLAPQQGVYVIEGEVRGEGPWKVGDYVIHVLGCHGTDAELAEDFSQWQMYLQAPLNDYPDAAERRELAREYGAIVDK